jgi:hypothetical protein
MKQSGWINTGLKFLDQIKLSFEEIFCGNENYISTPKAIKR